MSCDGFARVLRVAVSSARFSTAERVRDAPFKAKVRGRTAGLKSGTLAVRGEELGTFESGLPMCCLKQVSFGRAWICRSNLSPPSSSLKALPERVAARFLPKAIVSDPSLKGGA